jgi:hypothetical protein
VKNDRVISHLRRMFPDLKWRYNNSKFYWENNKKWHVERKVYLSMDGVEDDVGSHSEYVRSDTGEVITELTTMNLLSIKPIDPVDSLDILEMPVEYSQPKTAAKKSTQRSGPPYIQAFLKGGCVVCGSAHRGNGGFAHTSCWLKTAPRLRADWVGECENVGWDRGNS